MRIEIFVVKTKIDESRASEDKEDQILALRANSELMRVQNEILRQFGGATVIPNAKGLWINQSGTLFKDSVEIWLIYANTDKSFEENAQKKQITEDITAFNERIKKITSQDSQAYGIDGKLFFV
jgi:hypothetical protein